MNAADLQNLASGTVIGIVAAAVAVLGLLIGFCVLFDLPKLRRSGPRTRVVRSLDEALGSGEPYLTPDQPRGRIDQLHSPELLEAAARKSS
jgi:hypothetical protein